ncbi:hypothetical protein, partial [Dubosiella newyorkensis]
MKNFHEIKKGRCTRDIFSLTAASFAWNEYIFEVEIHRTNHTLWKAVSIRFWRTQWYYVKFEDNLN